MLKIKDNVNLKNTKDGRKLIKFGLHYEWLINGSYETITVVKDKNKPAINGNFVEEYNPFERFECNEFIIFVNDRSKKIQFRNGYDETNSKILKNLIKADLVERVK